MSSFNTVKTFLICNSDNMTYTVYDNTEGHWTSFTTDVVSNRIAL